MSTPAKKSSRKSKNPLPTAKMILGGLGRAMQAVESKSMDIKTANCQGSLAGKVLGTVNTVARIAKLDRKQQQHVKFFLA